MPPIKAQHAMATRPRRSHDKFLIIWKTDKDQDETPHIKKERGGEVRCTRSGSTQLASVVWVELTCCIAGGLWKYLSR